MAKHQVFLVHGMGQFERGWSAGTAQQIQDLCRSYPLTQAVGLDDAFDFVEITYAGVFDAWREQWKADAGAIAAKLVDGGLQNGVADALLKAGSAASGNSFLQTHVLDVVFYRFITPMAQEVAVSVLKQIGDRLASFTSVPSYSVIAHSLGSAVAYEALHAGITDSPPIPSSRLPVNFIAVSNTARLLWGRGGDLYTPTMGPSFQDHRGMCDRFFDIAHELDPVCRVDPFDAPPDRWFPEPAVRDLTYRHLTIDAADVQMPNVHALTHYLGHPSVHAPILRALAKSDEVISAADEAAALKQWRQQGLMKKAQASARQKARDALQQIVDAKADEWGAITAKLQRLREYVAQFTKQDGEN